MDNFKIKKVTLKNIGRLRQISIQTFSETFAHLNAEENMTKYLNEELSIEKLTNEINNKNSKFYFAILNHETVGYLKLNLNSAQTESYDNKALEIERIYVLKQYQGKHIGQQLFEKAVKVAKLIKAPYIWLGVWEENHSAIAFYKKNGFIRFNKHIFKLGNELQTDIMMKLQLNSC